MTTQTFTLSDAIAAAGTKSDLARLLGVSRQYVQSWGGQIPRNQVGRVREACAAQAEIDAARAERTFHRLAETV